jgi:uncharacterized protein YqkB
MATVRGFKIDATTGDLSFDAGHLEMVSGNEAIAQAIRARLRLIQGEWPFDTSVGVDYFGTILVKNYNRNAVEAEITREILDVAGVLALSRIDFVYSNQARTLTVTFEATLDNGELLVDTVEV